MKVENSQDFTVKVGSYCDEIANSFIALKKQAAIIEKIANICCQSLTKGNKIIFCGNGGSAADAQHLAAELVGRYKKNRAALAAISLVTDTSAITAIANDYSYQEIFSRQLEALGSAGDVVIAISTSGNSKNIIEVVTTAQRKNITAVAFTNANGGVLANMADLTLKVPAIATNHVQEMHIACGHMICGYVEEQFSC